MSDSDIVKWLMTEFMYLEKAVKDSENIEFDKQKTINMLSNLRKLRRDYEDEVGYAKFKQLK